MPRGSAPNRVAEKAESDHNAALTEAERLRAEVASLETQQADLASVRDDYTTLTNQCAQARLELGGVRAELAQAQGARDLAWKEAEQSESERKEKEAALVQVRDTLAQANAQHTSVTNALRKAEGIWRRRRGTGSPPRMRSATWRRNGRP